jgi:threonine dehydrogenase-like Zn-dependent dehydrogenase
MVALGVCGTDREIVAGKYGRPPPGSDSLVLGHESLGRVLEAPPGASVGVGVRHVPQRAASRGGIKELDGYSAELVTLGSDLVTGAGPVGLLATLLAAQRGFRLYVLDQVTEGSKPPRARRHQDRHRVQRLT